MTDPYESPKSELQARIPGTGIVGSLGTAVAGEYSYAISDVMKEAWSLVKGAKLPILLAGIIAIGIVMAVQQVIIYLSVDPQSYLSGGEFLKGIAISQLQSIVALPVTLPLLTGLMFVGINRACGKATSIGDLFFCFSKLVPLLAIGVISMICMSIGYILLFVPGLYLAVAYIFAAPLVVEKNLSPWQALESSRKAVTHSWFKTLGLILLLGLIVALSAIPLLIGLIWTLPFTIIAYGVLYRVIFGVEDLKEAV